MSQASTRTALPIRIAIAHHLEGTFGHSERPSTGQSDREQR